MPLLIEHPIEFQLVELNPRPTPLCVETHRLVFPGTIEILL